MSIVNRVSIKIIKEFQKKRKNVSHERRPSQCTLDSRNVEAFQVRLCPLQAQTGAVSLSRIETQVV